MAKPVVAGVADHDGWAAVVVVGEGGGRGGLGVDLTAPREALGAPWAADHRKAYAAALLAQRSG